MTVFRNKHDPKQNMKFFTIYLFIYLSIYFFIYLFIHFDHVYSVFNHKNIGSERLTERSEQLLKEIPSTSIMAKWSCQKNYN